MYNSSNLSKFKSQRNVCKIDLNDGPDRQRQSNTPTVSKRISNFSPTGHGSVRNSSSFHTLLSQLQPSTTKNPKNYSQQKQMLLTKKNEIIKNAIKQSLSINKKPGTPKLDTQENWEYTITTGKSTEKYAKENELPTDSGVRSREKMDQFYYNMGRARPVSVSKQHNVNRASDIASFISPKNRSFVQKAVIPNSTVNLSGISNTNEPKTANTTIIKYNQDYKDNNSYVKGRSFDLRPDASPSSKHPAQNRILLDLDESLNLAPLDQVKTSNTTAHARYSKSREDIQNILSSNIHYQPLTISDYLTRQPPANLPCRIIKESEKVEKPYQKEDAPNKDLFDLNMSPIKSNNRNLNNISDPYIKESDSRNAKNLANQPYPTIIKQINLNSNTPTSVGKPPLPSYAQQQQDYYCMQDTQQKAGQEALKHKTLNIQTVKENKKIEFPNYLQNLTCDRQKPMVDPSLSSKEAQHNAIFQPAMLNYIERLSRNRTSNENSREYIHDRTAVPDSHFRFPSYNDPSTRRSASGHMHRMSYGDAPKRLDLSSQNLKAARHDSMVDTTKHLLNTSDQLPNGRHLLDVGGKRPNDENENIVPQSIKANTFNPERYLKELNENVPIKENRASQDQNQVPPIPPKNFTNDEKELARRQSALNEANIMDLDPEEKEMRIKKFREEYVVGKQIGQGAYATVRIGLHKPTNTKVAIKIYEKVKIMDPMRRRSVRREIKLMQRMDHPNIIKILDVIETNNHMNIVMEYIGGTSLHSFLKAQPNRRLKEEHAFNIFKQIVSGLYYCHARCITHRDIKLENMLLDNHGNLKIIDFGFSTCIPNDKKVRMFCGTPSYMAPEIVTKIEYCGPPADIWALGVLLFALLSGTFPFRGENDKELYRKIANGEFVLPEYISEKASSLISKMITVDPDRRATSKEIMNDPWYLMHTFMEKKPERRTTRSSSAAVAEEIHHEKAENRLPLPMNINTGLPITEQQFMPIANYLKSPPYNPYMHTFERPSMTNVNPRDDDLSKEFMKHLSPNNFKSLSKQTPTAGYNPSNTFYIDNKNMTYNNINIKENPNGSYVGKDMTEGELGVPDDNFDENRLKCKKTLSEIEIWNVPANISEKSYKRDSGKSSFMQNRSFNKRGDENTNAYDYEIFSNMMKMGYKEDEINQGLRERNGSAYAIFNRMQNEKKALNYSNYADSINSDQNANNSFNLSSGTGLKRKSLNLFVQKNPSQGTQGKENAYGHVVKTASTKDFAANDEDVLRPLGSNTHANRKNIPW